MPYDSATLFLDKYFRATFPHSYKEISTKKNYCSIVSNSKGGKIRKSLQAEWVTKLWYMPSVDYNAAARNN